MDDKDLETSVHYKVLEAMAGEFKMEALEVLQMGEDKFKELEKCAPILFRYMRAMRPVFEGKKSVPEWVYSLYDTYQSVKKYLSNIQHITKGIHRLPADGWYFSLEFIDAFPYQHPDELLAKDPTLFESEAVETFERQAAGIQAKLLEGHPRRKHLIDAIFRLHNGGEYDAVIPVALSQADGICRDNFTITNKGNQMPVGFFSTSPIAPGANPQKLSKSFDLPGTSIFHVLCNQLSARDKNSSVLLESNTKRLSDLNRNAIMHGESVNYGTKVNSIKSILLLDFIEDLRIMDGVVKKNPLYSAK